jgi:acylphosphatase
MNQVGAEITVRGVVQGVGYRYFCHRHAINLNLTGWVKNDPDGSVFIYAEGDRSAVEALIDELKVGPYSATVSRVNVKWVAYTGNYDNFEITFRGFH